MSETKYPLPPEYGPYRLAIYNGKDELVTVITQLKVDNVRPKVEDALRAANAAEKWRESQREPTLRADEWQGVLAKLRALKSAQEGNDE